MGENAATLAVFLQHRERLIDYAGRLVGSRSGAEDLVQEAWLRFNRVGDVRTLDYPVPYLYRIVRNLAFDLRRQSSRERAVLSEGGFEPAAKTQSDEAPNPERSAVSKAELAVVLKAMDELPERTRFALRMSRFDGAKLREIAAELDVSVAMAHSLVADGIEHCKRRLAEANRAG